MSNKVTLEQWFSIADDYASSIGYATTGDPDDYKNYYESGYSPTEAILEDLSNLQ